MTRLRPTLEENQIDLNNNLRICIRIHVFTNVIMIVLAAVPAMESERSCACSMLDTMLRSKAFTSAQVKRISEQAGVHISPASTMHYGLDHLLH